MRKLNKCEKRDLIILGVLILLLLASMATGVMKMPKDSKIKNLIEQRTR